MALTGGVTERQNGELVHGKPKGDESDRVVRIADDVLEVLHKVREARPEAVFVAEGVRTPGVPTRPSQASRAAVRLLRAAGIGEGGWHSVRHGWIAAAIARGENPVAVARHAGHSPEVALKVYAGRQEAAVLQLGSRMADVFRIEREDGQQSA